MERVFRLSAHGTTVRTELLAGLTTFLTMACIVFIDPDILADAGMPRGSVFVATCLVAALGSLIMGLYANRPVALAPGMGLNAYFTDALLKLLTGRARDVKPVVRVIAAVFLVKFVETGGAD